MFWHQQSFTFYLGYCYYHLKISPSKHFLKSTPVVYSRMTINLFGWKQFSWTRQLARKNVRFFSSFCTTLAMYITHVLIRPRLIAELIVVNKLLTRSRTRKPAFKWATQWGLWNMRFLLHEISVLAKVKLKLKEKLLLYVLRYALHQHFTFIIIIASLIILYTLDIYEFRQLVSFIIFFENNKYLLLVYSSNSN